MILDLLQKSLGESKKRFFEYRNGVYIEYMSIGTQENRSLQTA